jgi:predicted PurR-regulated permease PerM
MFIVLVLGIFYLFAFMFRQAYFAFPAIAEKSIPAILNFAAEHDITLPFDDLPTLREASLEWIRHQLLYVGNFAKIATKEFAFLAIGFIVAISLFINPAIDLDRGRHHIERNLYSFACDEIATRFRSFYLSFARVMGAQLIISTINTGFTAVYLLAIHMENAVLVIAVTFLCGMLPIVGNLISNSMIVAISFTQSPHLAFASLIYLIVLHKLEYFLNSKIIGDRIKNPVWLTLLGLVLGERLMGIPGMILAPVILNFVKVEASQIPVSAEPVEKKPELSSSAAA